MMAFSVEKLAQSSWYKNPISRNWTKGLKCLPLCPEFSEIISKCIVYNYFMKTIRNIYIFLFL